MDKLFDPFAVGVFVLLALTGGFFVKRGSARLTREQVQELTTLGSDRLTILTTFAFLPLAYVAPMFPTLAVIVAAGLAAFGLYRTPYRLRNYWAGRGRRSMMIGTSLMALGGFLFVAVTAWRVGA